MPMAYMNIEPVIERDSQVVWNINFLHKNFSKTHKLKLTYKILLKCSTMYIFYRIRGTIKHRVIKAHGRKYSITLKC